tara:strand:+ start:446 stop:637 length:192 start_codon:yes stop_codon:yes gene_type:complete
MAYRSGRYMGEKGYETYFTTIQVRKKDFDRLNAICLKGEAKWKVVKRLIDAYEVANMKKKVKQ